ncbi:unnamed protein product, partial [Mesorhabditis spiculigera]
MSLTSNWLLICRRYLGELELKYALAKVYRHFDITAGEKFEASLQYFGWITVSPKSVTLKVQKRAGVELTPIDPTAAPQNAPADPEADPVDPQAAS